MVRENARCDALFAATVSGSCSDNHHRLSHPSQVYDPVSGLNDVEVVDDYSVTAIAADNTSSSCRISSK